MSVFDQIAQLGTGFQPASAVMQGQQIRNQNAMSKLQEQALGYKTDSVKTEDRLKYAATLARHVLGTDKLMRPAAYNEAVEQARQMGIDVSAMPRQYSDDVEGRLNALIALSSASSGGDEYGVAPVYATDESGKTTKAFQLSKSGGARQIDFGGLRPAKPLAWGDLGNERIGNDPFTGLPVQRYAKGLAPAQTPEYIREKEVAEAEGKSRGKSVADLPKVEANADYMISLLEGIKSHPGMKMAVGTSSVVPIIPGTPAADFVARLDQVQGQQFLQAFESLKGGGAITEIEGKKAESAIARMSRAQTEEEFVKGVEEFQDVIRALTEREKTSAANGRQGKGATQPQKQPTAAPTKQRLKYNPATGEFE